MTYVPTGGGGAAAAAIAQAIKASGVVVKMEPQEFQKLINRIEEPLVVVAKAGLLSSGTHYLTSYRGLAFHTKSKDDLILPGGTEVIAAKSVWLPM